MTLKKVFQGMPPQILVMFFLFALTPLTSLSFQDAPWAVYGNEGMLRAIVVGMTYWVLPVAICYAIAVKHIYFLPLYALQCSSLVWHSIVYHHLLPLDMAMARYVLIGFMAYIGFFFSNKDLLYPFITKDFRIWRRARRVKVSYEIHLLGDRPEHKIPAKVRDCSATGLAVIIDQRHMASFVKKKGRGDQLVAAIRWQGHDKQYHAEIIWTSGTEESRSIGLRVPRNEGLEEFVSWVQDELRYESRLYRSQSPLLQHDLHQTALTFWVLFIALSFGLPAFAHF